MKNGKKHYNMEKYKIPIILSLISILGLYLCGSFFELDFNPKNWDGFTLGIVSIFSFVCPFAIIMNKTL